MTEKTRNNRGNTVINDAVEVVADPSVTIEAVTAQEFGGGLDPIAEEAFMNEFLVVEVAESTNENDPPYVSLSVNDRTQPVRRGVPTRVRRKYVEVLARCKESKYRQNTPNPNEPDRIEMIERSALTFPFQVLEDPNPKGRAWLRAVLAEAN